jgi:hypothetical protein
VPERIARTCICCGSAGLDRSPAILMPFVAHRVIGWTPVEITPDWGLRTIPTGMAYPLCASLQCRDCGCLFLDIRFDDEEMARLYGGYRDAAYAAERDRFEPGYAAHNASILAHMPDTSWVEGFTAPFLPDPPRVLDWGGDDGRNAPFRGKGAAVEVYDLSDQPVLDGVRRVGRADMARGGHDLIVLSHVLEHVAHPAEVLAEVAGVMGPDALLYIEVPFETLMAEAPGARDLASRKKHWHEHINFFTEDAMAALLARAGLASMAWELRALPSHANFTQVLSIACRLAAPAGRAHTETPRRIVLAEEPS